MQTIDESLLAGGAMIDLNSRPVESSIVPIFHYAVKARPEFVGSGVYFSIGGSHFLITAKHVAGNKPDQFVIPQSTEEFDSIPTSMFVHTESDEIDVAVAQLDTPLPMFIPIQKGQLVDLDESRHIPNRLIALGFPGSKVRATSTEVKTLLKKYASTEASRLEYTRLSVDRRVTHVLDFDKTQVISLTKGMSTFPNPNGMSGGGLFWMHHKGILEREPVLLGGILTEWDPKTKKGMKATKIKYVLAMISARFGVEIDSKWTKGISIKK